MGGGGGVYRKGPYYMERCGVIHNNMQYLGGGIHPQKMFVFSTARTAFSETDSWIYNAESWYLRAIYV